MSVEKDIHDLLTAVVPRTNPQVASVYPDVAPMSAVPPYATYQQVGGESLTYLGNEVPSKKNGRFQITVWAKRRLEASALALAIENAFLMATNMQATPLGSPIAAFEDVTEFYGTHQDFSVWSDR
jgi:hypothetical protein